MCTYLTILCRSRDLRVSTFEKRRGTSIKCEPASNKTPANKRKEGISSHAKHPQNAADRSILFFSRYFVANAFYSRKKNTKNYTALSIFSSKSSVVEIREIEEEREKDKREAQVFFLPFLLFLKKQLLAPYPSTISKDRLEISNERKLFQISSLIPSIFYPSFGFHALFCIKILSLSFFHFILPLSLFFKAFVTY